MALRRVPIRGGVPPSQPKYLFAEKGSPYEITLILRDKLKKELASIPPEKLLSAPADDLVKEIVQRYTLEVPVLDRKGTQQYDPVETKMQVPQNSQFGFFAGPGPHFLDATEFKIRVPFIGDPNLFKYSTTGYGNFIEGEVVDGYVVLTHTTPKPDPEKINQDFNDRLNRIESTLGFSRQSVSDWNNGLPNQVRPAVEQRLANIHRNQSISLGFERVPATPASAAPVASQQARPAKEYDVFLSHASEDKDAIARPLYDALVAAGVSVWFDEAALVWGDGLRRKIDDGLARCKYGVVIISPSFLSKEWPQRELDGLAAREIAHGKTIILPIWHDIDQAGIAQKAPMLADRLAAKSTVGIDELVQKVLQVIRQ